MQIGDWVVCKDADGRILKGFIEEIENRDNTAKIYVIESERESDAGQVRWAKQYSMRVLEMGNSHDTEGAVWNMIDFALITKDFTLFSVYADRLRELQGKKKGAYLK